MQLYPAIDLKDGQCVRLTQGRFDDAAIYETDPAQAALRWQKEGAAFLHLVDLDGARTGRSANAEASPPLSGQYPSPFSWAAASGPARRRQRR